MGRNHIRVDVFHDKFPRWMQAALNWLSIVALAAFGAFIAWVAFKVIGDTLQYRSTAQTPWATPLIIPQTVWYVGLVTFAGVPALIQRWESDVVEVKVPFKATTGPVEMVIGKKKLSAGTFTVVAPRIANLIQHSLRQRA